VMPALLLLVLTLAAPTDRICFTTIATDYSRGSCKLRLTKIEALTPYRRMQ